MSSSYHLCDTTLIWSEMYTKSEAYYFKYCPGTLNFMASPDGETIQGGHYSSGRHYRIGKGFDKGHYPSNALFWLLSTLGILW